METNINFTNTEVGETICYHIGNLAADRDETEFSYEEGRQLVTENAAILRKVANELYARSCALGCTGEFELKQKRLRENNYAYLAKRVKKFTNK